MAVSGTITKIGDIVTVSYTNKIQTFVVPITGLYLLSAWGGQGGDITTFEGGTKTTTSAKGGRAYSYAVLESGTTLYIATGGKGATLAMGTTDSSASGGYNGGGLSRFINAGTTTGSGGGSGGGATHIATKTGVLSSLAKSNVLCAAGGGGGTRVAATSGSISTQAGGAGGGTTGGSGAGSGVGGGGTQSAGGAAGGEGTAGTFGTGGSISSNHMGPGGGGGYYGGGSGSRNGGGGGGSGFVKSVKQYDGSLGVLDYNGSMTNGNRSGSGQAQIKLVDVPRPTNNFNAYLGDNKIVKAYIGDSEISKFIIGG